MGAEGGVTGTCQPLEVFGLWVVLTTPPGKDSWRNSLWFFSFALSQGDQAWGEREVTVCGEKPNRGRAASGAGSLLDQPWRPAAKNRTNVRIWKQSGDRALISSSFSTVRRWIGIKVTATCIPSVRAAE